LAAVLGKEPVLALLGLDLEDFLGTRKQLRLFGPQGVGSRP